MRTIEIKIRRTDGRLQTYWLSLNEQEIYSVLNALELIYQSQDGTLGFFSHAACRQAACGQCLVKINGQNRLACKTPVEDGMVLEPWNGKSVIRDLLCRNPRP